MPAAPPLDSSDTVTASAAAAGCGGPASRFAGIGGRIASRCAGVGVGVGGSSASRSAVVDGNVAAGHSLR